MVHEVVLACNELLLASFSKRGQVQNHSHVKENLFPYEWLCTWSRFEKKPKNNSERAIDF